MQGFLFFCFLNHISVVICILLVVAIRRRTSVRLYMLYMLTTPLSSVDCPLSSSHPRLFFDSRQPPEASPCQSDFFFLFSFSLPTSYSTITNTKSFTPRSRRLLRSDRSVIRCVRCEDILIKNLVDEKRLCKFSGFIGYNVSRQGRKD